MVPQVLTRRRLAVALLAAGSLVVTVVLAAGTDQPAAAAARCPAAQRTVVVSTPATAPRTVALTFDDGPSRFTPQVLAVLRAKGVRATFFVTGRDARRDPAMLRRIVAAGHRIGNHSDTHPQDAPGSVPRGSFDTLARTTRARQMDRASSAILAATGVRPCFFRSPGGHHRSATTVALARDRRMTVVGWTLDTRDWAQPRSSSRSAQQAILRAATAGSSRHPVILFHDGKASPEPESRVSANRSNTVAVLGRVIDHYRARGYVFTDPAGARLTPR